MPTMCILLCKALEMEKGTYHMPISSLQWWRFKFSFQCRFLVFLVSVVMNLFSFLILLKSPGKFQIPGKWLGYHYHQHIQTVESKMKQSHFSIQTDFSEAGQPLLVQQVRLRISLLNSRIKSLKEYSRCSTDISATTEWQIIIFPALFKRPNKFVLNTFRAHPLGQSPSLNSI